MAPYAKIFQEMNATPSYFMREITPVDARLLPPLVPVYQDPKPCPKSNPTYTTVSMAAFSKENFEGFPVEMMPGKGERIRSQTNQFTSSFIAGAYRDNRMGVAELRKKRIERLKVKQGQLALAQKALADDVEKIKKRSARRILRDIERTRRLHDLLSISSATIIQKHARSWHARKQVEEMRQVLRAEELTKQKIIQDEIEYNAASLIARVSLKHLAFKYSRISRRMEISDCETTSLEGESLGDDDNGDIPPADTLLKRRESSRRSLKETGGAPSPLRRRGSFAAKEKANNFLNSLLIHQQNDNNGQLVTNVMLKLLNESPVQSRRSMNLFRESSDEEETPKKTEEEIQREGLMLRACCLIQRVMRGIVGRIRARQYRLVRKCFKAWRSYRAPRSRSLSRAGSEQENISRPQSATGTRPTTPQDLFSASILELLKLQKQDELEEESAIIIQCFLRRGNALHKTVQLRKITLRNIQKEREKTAKAIIARIPKEKPDRSCTSAWLQYESMKVQTKRSVEHGVVDLSKTSRNPFWLHEMNDVMEHQRNGLKNTGRASSIRSSSVSGILSSGLGPYFKPSN